MQLEPGSIHGGNNHRQAHIQQRLLQPHNYSQLTTAGQIQIGLSMHHETNCHSEEVNKQVDKMCIPHLPLVTQPAVRMLLELPGM